MPTPVDTLTSFDRVLALFAITYLIGTLSPFLGGLQPPAPPTIEESVRGSAAAQLTGGLVYAATAVMLLRDRERGWLRLLASPALALCLAVMVASVAWSLSPGVSVRRIAGVLGCVVVAAYLASRFKPDAVVRMLAYGYLIAVVVSIALSLALPGVAGSLLDQPGGVWGHKNDLGRALVFSTLAAWALLMSRGEQSRAWMSVLLAASLLLIAVSRSAQAVLVALLAIGAFWPLVAFISRRHRRLGWGAIGILIGAGLAGAVAIEYIALPVLDALGRDATLTDRTLIWELVSVFGQESPWVGHGYGAFWTTAAASMFGDRWQVIDHAHNGYLDIWLDLGYLGLAAFWLLLISAQVRAWNAALAEPGSAARFFPAFLLAAMLLNTVGHVFPAHNSIYWTLLCYAALLPSRMPAIALDRAAVRGIA